MATNAKHPIFGKPFGSRDYGRVEKRRVGWVVIGYTKRGGEHVIGEPHDDVEAARDALRAHVRTVTGKG